ncbi:uncharacterized protein LOC112345456 isoform X1 [Selaginella moellendorffii]|uniref:uncharacterized protein LOC112345456 isoform X1 n=1 Tax=Selaginella moellendorffii TaxID=88036 RepID=UPI000D1C9319|nr:uncharacterized protein LOC112345456 isoform X1 [Selaginella moellendorffii]|eukprot:XP_024528008.1 uncharacterized protein LOC112345456 isoform X1 [Selaginella moellendorffii]
MTGGIPTELWDTTYNDYGRFYKSAKRQLEDAASKCERKCEKLSRELMDCQKTLDELKMRTKNDNAAGTGESSSPSRRALKGMLRYQSSIPNLRVPGYTHAADEEDRKSQKEQVQQEMQFMRIKKKDQDIERMRMEHIVNAYRYRQLFPAEYNMEHKNYPPPSRHHVFDLQPQRRFEKRVPAPLHPSVTRYTHYKFYGYGGHGAKTSWGHNMPLGKRVRHCKRTRILPSH